MDTGRFFSALPALSSAEAMCDPALHADAPGDWWVAVADITQSTLAIAQGRYKDVNAASASAIVAVLNAADADSRGEVAYVFGGDGATFLVPPRLKRQTAAALHGARRMARRGLGLDMRAGMVEVRELRARGAPVRAAKIEMGEGRRQAALSGGGVALAEQLVKDPEAGGRHDIAALFDEGELAAIEADFTGLECRWRPLQSRNGVNVSLIVQARGGDDAANAGVYREVLAEIARLCGAEEGWRPVSEAQLSPAAAPRALMTETRIRADGQGAAGRLKYLARATVLAWTGVYCFAFGKKAGSFDGRTYRRSVTENSDYIKFDNILRLVMDVTPGQQAALQGYLDDLLRQGRAFYGLHAAPSALMTCMVFDYAAAHLHFIDGAGGGYSLAAQQLKGQVKGQ